jgi:hypothetical protein
VQFGVARAAEVPTQKQLRDHIEDSIDHDAGRVRLLYAVGHRCSRVRGTNQNNREAEKLAATATGNSLNEGVHATSAHGPHDEEMTTKLIIMDCLATKLPSLAIPPQSTVTTVRRIEFCALS